MVTDVLERSATQKGNMMSGCDSPLMCNAYNLSEYDAYQVIEVICVTFMVVYWTFPKHVLGAMQRY